ncbi:MAG: sensor histidine kinase [Pseudomonadota bacterium]
MPAARLLLLLLLALPAAGIGGTGDTTPPPRTGPDAAPFQPLDNGQLAVLADPAGNLTLGDVRAADAAGRLQPLAGNLGAGFTGDVYWLRFRIAAASQTDRWWLEVLPSFLDEVQLYLIHPDGSVDARRCGDRTLRDACDLDHSALLFRLDLPAGENTAYLRIATSSSMIGILRLWREDALMQASFAQYLVYGLYLGLVAAILLLIGINWLLLRDPLYLLYVAYVAMLLLYSLSTSGLVAQYLIPDTPALPDLMVGLGLSLAAAFGLAFFARMLDLANGHRWLERLFMGGTVVAILTAVSAVGGYYLHVGPWLQGTLSVIILCTLPVAVAHVRRGTTTRRLAGLAFIVYGLMVLGSSLPALGLLPAFRLSLVSAHLGNLAHLFLLHAAIVLHMRDSTREREELALQAARARNEMESERRQRDEHDQFLSMVAHEIRTPISVIDAATQSLQLLDEKPPLERAARYERIQRAVLRLNLLLELALNQVRPGSRKTAGGQCDLIELTYDVVDQFEPQHNQQLNVFMAMEKAAVRGRAELLRFVLINLIDNACKYSPPHSTIDIEVAMERRDGRDGHLWLITDQGAGVSPADHERIFDKYFRGGENAATAGLGLGLYVARHIVGQAGGTLRCIVPPPGRGARFECWLPRAEGG